MSAVRSIEPRDPTDLPNLAQIIDPLPPTATRTASSLYPDGAHLTDLKEVRDLIYKMQRPGIAPELVFVVDWKPNTLALFHNRGVLHSITGALRVCRTLPTLLLVGADSFVSTSSRSVCS